MPFRATCRCGLSVEGDCSQNAYLLLGEPRHLHIDHGRIDHDEPLRIETIPIGGPRHIPAAHAKERAVVWRHPQTGEVAYPGRNDIPMPVHYQARGFERHELPTLRDLDRFQSRQGVVNEKAHYDSNGKADR